MAHLETIDAARAAALVREGAVMVDVREAHEHAAEHIPGARHVALSLIDRSHPDQPGDRVLIFHCKSGARTKINAPRLAAAAGGCKAYLLGGGIDAWRRAGLPTSRSAGPQGSASRGFLQRLFG